MAKKTIAFGGQLAFCWREKYLGYDHDLAKDAVIHVSLNQVFISGPSFFLLLICAMKVNIKQTTLHIKTGI